MNLKYFTKDAYLSLKKDLSINEEKYYSDMKWVEEYFRDQGIDEFCKESSVVVKDVDLVYSGNSDQAKNNDDLTNTMRVYSAFKENLTPAMASNPLMWSALCHFDYRDYVLNRWKKNDGEIRLEQRFFATEGRSSLVYYNALSRLWWSGYLTYDDTEEDAWANTKTLFSAQQIQKDLFDQSYSMNKSIVKGLLRALRRIQIEKKNACTSVFRKCCDSFFNHYGAVNVVDVLSPDEIETIAYNYMKSESDEEKKFIPKDRLAGKRKQGSKRKKGKR